MRALCKKLLRCYFQQHTENTQSLFSSAQRNPTKFLLLAPDHNDIEDLTSYYIAASTCQPTSRARSYSYSELREQFSTRLGLDIAQEETFRIAAYRLKEQQAADMGDEQQQQHMRDAAEGAILGAFVGDAAGGVLEFKSFTPEQVEEALQMPGGGVWGLGPGQITDDSEMALCLLQGLLGAPPTGPIPLDSIAAAYIKWLHSPPFDIGETTRNALGVGGGAEEQKAGLGARMTANAAQLNQHSLSNGCLMRVTPLAVWAHQQPADVIAQHASAQTALTHPNKIAQVGTAAYCIAIAHLISHPRDAQGAIAAARNWLQDQQQQENSSSTQPSEGEDAAAAANTVLGWLQEALQPGPGPQVQRNIGFMRWGFVHAFRALHLELPYTEAIRAVLLLGGDTDTNAAIVGGLVGALWGAAAIPASMKQPVLSFGRGSGGQPRPSFLHAEQQPRLFEQLWRDTTASG